MQCHMQICLTGIPYYSYIISNGELIIDHREQVWLDTMQNQLEAIPEDHERFISDMVEANANEKFVPSKYDF